MEAVNHNIQSCHDLPLKKVTEIFFSKHSLDSAKYMFFKFFQCWSLKDCKIKAEISDEEVALFFDQLTDLVAAAYILHQANGASDNQQEGGPHD
jgi:hypothetical protein